MRWSPGGELLWAIIHSDYLTDPPGDGDGEVSLPGALVFLAHYFRCLHLSTYIIYLYSGLGILFILLFHSLIILNIEIEFRLARFFSLWH